MYETFTNKDGAKNVLFGRIGQACRNVNPTTDDRCFGVLLDATTF